MTPLFSNDLCQLLTMLTEGSEVMGEYNWWATTDRASVYFRDLTYIYVSVGHFDLLPQWTIGLYLTTLGAKIGTKYREKRADLFR